MGRDILFPIIKEVREYIATFKTKDMITLLNLKRSANMLLAASVSLVICSSCADEDLYKSGYGNEDIIGFGMTAVLEGENIPHSRVEHSPEPLVMVNSSNSDTLYLHSSVEDNPSPVSAGATRGTPVTENNFKEVYGAFAVTAYTETGDLYMNDKVGTESGGYWFSDGGERYWPETETLDFYARAPYEFNKKDPLADETVVYSDKKVSFTYTTPTSEDGKDAMAQPDLLFAFASKNQKQTVDGCVELTFRHALAAVKFVAQDISKGTIKSIKLKNVYGAGKCVYDPSSTTGKYVWEQTGERKDFVQSFNVEVEDQQTGEQKITDVNPETTFMMVPQPLDENSSIEVVLETADGETHFLTAPFKKQDWEAGKIYTYVISTESINWTYVFEVTDKIDMALGQTTSKYSVKSYRYRTQNPDVKEPVSWEVTGKNGTETKYPSTTPTPIIDVNGIIKGFTYSDNGDDGTGSGNKYDIILDKSDMHTTHSGDETLKKNTVKGSPESPYDLSTDGGSSYMTTANCYAVNSAGTYMLPLVYGNAIVNGRTNFGAYSDSHFVDYNNSPISSPYISSSGTPDDCTLVWSDGFYMFKDVHLSADKQYLVFTIDQEYMQQANAIVAVRDANDNIMWSWHIWVIERDINATVEVDDYTSSATYQMMTCNLGWVDEKMVYYDPRSLNFTFTQDRSGKKANLTVTQEGAQFDYKDIGSTYYQWGRKDPIVALMNRDHTGVNDYRRLDTTDPKYLYKVARGLVSMADAIKNPNIYYVQPNNGDIRWLNDGAFSWKFWNMESNGGNVNIAKYRKTVYDPSPKGFIVPIPRTFSVFVNGSTALGDRGGTLNGKIDPQLSYRYLVHTKRNQKGEELPFTATGQRSSRDNLGSGSGSLWALDGVYYWSSESNYDGSDNSDKGKSYTFVVRKDNETDVYSYGFVGTQAMARPVRCIRE